jgi:hypothetical protein
VAARRVDVLGGHPGRVRIEVGGEHRSGAETPNPLRRLHLVAQSVSELGVATCSGRISFTAAAVPDFASYAR